MESADFGSNKDGNERQFSRSESTNAINKADSFSTLVSGPVTNASTSASLSGLFGVNLINSSVSRKTRNESFVLHLASMASAAIRAISEVAIISE